MTIRLTSVEAFEKVLEKLKQNPLYDEPTNEPFFKYCVDAIKEGLSNGYDEWYLDVEWIAQSWSRKVVMRISYHNRFNIMTDEEYLDA